MTELPPDPVIGNTYYWSTNPLVYDALCEQTLMQINRYYIPGMKVQCDSDKFYIEYEGLGWSDGFIRCSKGRQFGSAWRSANPTADYLCVVHKSTGRRSTITVLLKTCSKVPAIVSSSETDHLKWVGEKYKNHWVASYRGSPTFFLIDPVTYQLTEFEKHRT